MCPCVDVCVWMYSCAGHAHQLPLSSQVLPVPLSSQVPVPPSSQVPVPPSSQVPVPLSSQVLPVGVAEKAVVRGVVAAEWPFPSLCLDVIVGSIVFIY